MDTSSELKYCPFCMKLDNIGESKTCPHCHYELETAKNGKEDLPIYTVIDNRYMVGKVKEHTDDSNRYIGLDLTNKKKVWIREFFYRSLVYRNQESTNIQTYVGQKEAYLKKYDACVREYQKIREDKKIVFSNGTVYQIIPLSEEEINALCQHQVSISTTDSKHNLKKDEKPMPIQRENRQRKKISTNLVSSKKVKIAIMALLAVCLLGSVLQIYDMGKIIGGGKKTENASVSMERKKETPAPAKKAAAETAAPKMPGSSPAMQVSFSPTPTPSAEANHVKTTDVPKGTPNNAPKSRKKTKTIKRSTPLPTKQPAATRKPTKRPSVTKKRKKRKNTIDDSTVDSKVYEIK